MYEIDDECTVLWSKLWPALCHDNIYNVEMVEQSLPDIHVDLEPFSITTMPNVPKIGKMGRHQDLRKKYLFLRSSFSGQSHLSFLLACTIVALRRAPENKNIQSFFHRILSEHTDQICADLNLRWLVSVCDTLVDCGKSPAQIAIGFSGSALVNTVKIYETERAMYAPNIPWPPSKRFGYGGKLFDGVDAFSAPKGDMINNLIARAFTAAEGDAVAGAIMLEILARLQYRKTAFQRFKQIEGKDHVEVLEPKDVGDIEHFLQKRLS